MPNLQHIVMNMLLKLLHNQQTIENQTVNQPNLNQSSQKQVSWSKAKLNEYQWDGKNIL